MKKRIKINVFIALCFTILFAGCQSDDESVHEHVHNSNGVKEKMITLNELRTMPKAMEVINKIQQNTRQAGTEERNIYNEKEDFIIDTDNVLMIENGKYYHSLTFPIINTNPEEESLLKNLVLSLQDDGSYLASLYIYDLSPEEIHMLETDIPFMVTTPINRVELPDFNTESLLAAKLVSVQVTEFIVVACGSGKHHRGNMGEWHQCDLIADGHGPRVYTVTHSIVIEVPDEWNGGFPDGGGDGGGSGGGGGGSFNPDDIELVKGNITRPIVSNNSVYPAFYNGLNGIQKGTFDNNNNLKDAVINFLEATKVNNYTYSPESVSFAHNALDLAYSYPDMAISIINFAAQNPDNIAIAQQMLDYIGNDDDMEDKIEIVEEMIQALNSNDDTESNAVKMTLVAANNNYLESPFDQNYYNLISPYIDNNSSDPGYAVWAMHFSIQCAFLKAEHPDWSNAKIYWEASKEMVHLALDIVGLVPVVGEVADLTNGIIYAIEGDGLNATLSIAAMIPVAGIGATTVKLAKKTIAITPAVKTTLIWHKNAQNLYTFGNRSQLRKILKLAKGDPRQAHHIIPWGKSNHPAIQKAAGSSNAFHMNEALNGIPLSTSVHSGSHANYDNLIQNYLNAIPTSLTPDETYNAVIVILNKVKTAVQNNPGVHINQLTF